MENGKAVNESRNPSRKFNEGAIPPETLSKSIASFANTPIQATNGSWQNVNSIALARDSQAIHDRKKPSLFKEEELKETNSAVQSLGLTTHSAVVRL